MFRNVFRALLSICVMYVGVNGQPNVTLAHISLQGFILIESIYSEKNQKLVVKDWTFWQY